ncbi:MAG: helix-turn-helix transcriptional regulator [Halofilum sp. (in: g-proteobacteria)]|nr:helix-turn-helix transcriptional regulator [Halofilum sp. (in: g-proteobacteria)]
MPACRRACCWRDRQTATLDLLAVVAPLASPGAESDLGDEWPDASIALYVGDLDDTGLLRPDILRDLYGLTDAEARLAVAIGRGRELPELADCWQVSVETLRSHLKSVFAKIGVNRQIDLVRLLAGTPWKMAAPLDRQADQP